MQILETYQLKIDAKGRIPIPTALRKCLAEKLSDGFYVRRSMHERCLELYPRLVWERELAKVQSLNPYVREHSSFIRKFMAGVRFVEVDGAGRINIPVELAKWSSLAYNIVISPMGDVLEIWDTDTYEDVLGGCEQTFSSLAEKLMGDPKNEEQIK